MMKTILILFLFTLCACGGGGGGGGSATKTSEKEPVIVQNPDGDEELRRIKEEARTLDGLWVKLTSEVDSSWNGGRWEQSSQLRRGIEFGQVLVKEQRGMGSRKAEFVLDEFLKVRENEELPNFELIAKKIIKENLK